MACIGEKVGGGLKIAGNFGCSTAYLGELIIVSEVQGTLEQAYFRTGLYSEFCVRVQKQQKIMITWKLRSYSDAP